MPSQHCRGPTSTLPLLGAVTISEVSAPSDAYRVEVSGWDENESFFVEKSDLAWDDFAGHRISLQAILPDGALVFVLTLLLQGLAQSPPIVYKVEFIGGDHDGHHQFRLNAVQVPPGNDWRKLERFPSTSAQ